MGLLDRLKLIFGARGGSGDSGSDAGTRAAGGEEGRRREFQRRAAAVARELPGVRSARAGDGFELLCDVADGPTRRVRLENAFREIRERSEEPLDAELRRFLGPLLAAEREYGWEEAAPLLMPTLRAGSFPLALGAQLAASPRSTFEAALTSPLTRPTLELLAELIVLDEPDRIRAVTRDLVERWGKSAEEVFARAHDNARRLLATPPERCDDAAGPLWRVPTDDFFEGSRLIVSGFLAWFRGRVDGNPIAIAPERGQIFVGGDARPETIVRLAGIAERSWEASGRGISPALYTIDADGRPTPYRLPGAGVAARAVRRGHALLALREYAELRGAWTARPGDGVVLPELQAVATGDDVLFTFAEWTATATHLPLADRFLFAIEDEPEPWSLPRSLVEAELGAYCERSQLLGLPVLAVRELPPAAARAALRPRGATLAQLEREREAGRS